MDSKSFSLLSFLSCVRFRLARPPRLLTCFRLRSLAPVSSHARNIFRSGRASFRFRACIGILAFEEVAPLHAARTSQRDVPATLNTYTGGEGWDEGVRFIEGGARLQAGEAKKSVPLQPPWCRGQSTAPRCLRLSLRRHLPWGCRRHARCVRARCQAFWPRAQISPVTVWRSRLRRKRR